jgi:hypothetical protein
MNKQQWMASKARKRINMSLRLGLPLLALAFAAQIVIGSFSTVPTEARPGSQTGGQQLMNDPNQEVTGGIANVGGVNGLGGPMNGNGGVSGSVVRGSSANPKAITKLGVTILDFDGKKLVFEYFDIRITGHLSPEMVTKWKDSPELAPEKMAVLYVREKSAFEGLEATDGETADIGEIVFIEARAN